MEWHKVVFAVAIAYLIGSIPIGYLIGRAHGVNILQHGSGRTGGTNVLRALGFGPAALTVLGDALKAAAAIALARHILLTGELGAALAGAAAIIGHNWSVFLKFRGGAGGMSTAAGLIALNAYVGVPMVVIAAIVFYLSRYASVATLTASVGGLAALTVILLAFPAVAHWEHLVYGFLTSLACVWALRPNIQRLLAGTERRVTRW
ncbi:glycerol-3-phosphate acyltransferase [Candidatus Amarolinea aalborgensis]|jgi:glycerol-3-phosphate acyltransferase PlsY|uniref:glycerol-3-phosphate acyltransferase n=1 Tax=Candidatus Amarolinea aalborgensis TaxID=2249329 RepID=UPI003BFA048E